MKKINYLITLLLFISMASTAQVRIGNATDPHEGAILDLKSSETSTKGLLLPNVNLSNLNTFQLSTNAANAKGMMIYNTNETIGKGVYVWNGSRWNKAEADIEEPIDPNLPGTPGDWVISNGSGDGIFGAAYINICPEPTVELTTKGGYSFGDFTPNAATLSGNKLTFDKTGRVFVTKGEQSGAVYVEISSCEVLVDEVIVTGNDDKVNAGKTLSLTASFLPTDATLQEVTWKTSSDAIATIDANGVLTGVSGGNVTVTATAKDSGQVEGYYSVTVIPQSIASMITVTPPAANCTGEEFTLSASASAVTAPVFRWYESATSEDVLHTGKDYVVSPAATTDYYVSVFGDNYFEGAASEVGRKKVTATVKQFSTADMITATDPIIFIGGTATLTAMALGDIINPVFKWYLSVDAPTELYIGNDYSVSPMETTTYYVSVEGDNYCEGAATTSGRKAVKVTVNPILVSGITISGPKSLVIGSKNTITNSIEPANPTNKNLKWSTSNSQMASINETTGQLTANRIGYVTITAESTDGSKITSNSIEVFIADKWMTIEEVSNNLFGSYNFDGDKWMVTNSRLGTPDATSYANNDSINVGYYYSTENAKTACPANWHLPTDGEWSRLRTRLNSGNSNGAEWWFNNEYGAFDGRYKSNLWDGAVRFGQWWVVNSSRAYYCENNNMASTLLGDTWGSVRCVKDKIAMSGSPSTWVTSTGSGSGTPASPYTNNCPATTVELTPKSGYAFLSGTVTPADAATLAGGKYTFSKNGTVGVYKGDEYGTISVTVIPQSTGSMITASDKTINNGSEASLTASVSGVTNATFKWYESATSTKVLATSASYKVSPTATTSYYVSVSGDNYCEGAATTSGRKKVTVTVRSTASMITASDQTINSGSEATLTASVSGVTNATFKWYDSATSTKVLSTGASYKVSPTATTSYYVSVSGTNLIEGEANTTGRKKITVTVNILVRGITISGPKSLVIGSKNTITNSIEPANPTNKNLKWSTSNSQMASINETTGQLTANRIGYVTITAESTDGSKITSNSIEVFIADKWMTIEEVSNNLFGSYNFDGDKWMVTNSRLGTPDATSYANNDSINVGYYYSTENAKTACPANWHLPTDGEWSRLRTRLNSGNSNGAEWWFNNEYGAFDGRYKSNLWDGAVRFGQWWVVNSSRAYYCENNNMASTLLGDTWGSVRCVKDKIAMSGSPSTWVTSTGSGSGTPASPYTNNCPATTVELTPKSGYAFLSGTVTPADAATLAGGKYTFSKNGTVGVYKGDEYGTISVTVIPQSTGSMITASDKTINNGSEASLTASVSGVTNATFKWYESATSTKVLATSASYKVSPTATTSYYVSVSGDNYCEGAATTSGRKKVTVTVNNILVTKIEIAGANSVDLGATTTFTVKTLEPSNPTNSKVKWDSSKPEYATIDGNGKLTGVSAGSTVITATAEDAGGVKSVNSITVTVKLQVTSGGNVYPYALIGDMYWMTKNSVSGNYSARYYKNDPGYGDQRGAYYSYANAAGACPDGFRLPSAPEARQLFESWISNAGSDYSWGLFGIVNTTYYTGYMYDNLWQLPNHVFQIWTTEGYSAFLVIDMHGRLIHDTDTSKKMYWNTVRCVKSK